MAQAPLDLAAWLCATYKLDFTPKLIESKEELIAHLRSLGQQPEEWGTKDDRTRSLDELWEEHEDDDNVLAILPDGSVGRFIRTVTLYVKRDISVGGGLFITEVLREYVIWPDGREEERSYQNSGSEKLKVTEMHPDAAIRRFFKDELGLSVSKKHRRYPFLQKIVGDTLKYFKGAAGSERAVNMHPSRSYPMVVTYNRLYHYLWNMTGIGRQYWRKIYRENHKRKTLEFRWRRAAGPWRPQPEGSST